MACSRQQGQFMMTPCFNQAFTESGLGEWISKPPEEGMFSLPEDPLAGAECGK